MASILEVKHFEKGLILNRCEILSNNTQQIKYRHTSFYCTSLYGTLWMLRFFLQIESKTLHQRKDYDLYYFSNKVFL